MVNVSEDASGNIVHHNPDTGQSSVYHPGDIAFVLVGTFLVWLMAPGVAFFYSGLLRRKNALSMIYLGMATLAVVSVQWMLFGCVNATALPPSMLRQHSPAFRSSSAKLVHRSSETSVSLI